MMYYFIFKVQKNPSHPLINKRVLKFKYNAMFTSCYCESYAINITSVYKLHHNYVMDYRMML